MTLSFRKERKTTGGGCHPEIKDRFDLTLECIRFHYWAERTHCRRRLIAIGDSWTRLTSSQKALSTSRASPRPTTPTALAGM
jgi:hypothetical protein